MPPRRAKSDALFSTRWVHAYEEDTSEGQVYRPESEDLPLSRRPREWLELSRDGSARLFVAGAADRPEGVEGRWLEEGGDVVVRLAGTHNRGTRELRIHDRSPDRLLVRD